MAEIKSSNIGKLKYLILKNKKKWTFDDDIKIK